MGIPLVLPLLLFLHQEIVGFSACYVKQESSPTPSSHQQHKNPVRLQVLANFFYTKIGVAPSLHLSKNTHNTIINELNSPGIPELTQPFTPAEATQAMASFRPGKAASHDLIPYYFLTHVTQDIQEHLLQLINTSWRTGEFSSCWKLSVHPHPGHQAWQGSSTPVTL